MPPSDLLSVLEFIGFVWLQLYTSPDLHSSGERGTTFPTSSSLPFLFVPHLLWLKANEEIGGFWVDRTFSSIPPAV
ncbi:hypothetical protein R3I94_009584 [Phoxinus phoxinus]